MARPISSRSTLPIHIIPSIYIVFAVMLIMCIFSLVSFLCASHRKQNEEAFTRKKISTRKNWHESFSKVSNMSSKALLKMVSWRKQVQHGDDDDDDESHLGYYDIKSHDYIAVDGEGFQGEDAVWKKTIIKGEKCKPLEFSGKIEYDSEGNLLPDHDKPVVGDKEKVISSTEDVFVS